MKRKPDKNSKFAERMRGLRRERCLSMDAFCDKFNERQTAIRLCKSTISRYERGAQEPMLSTVAALADFFGVSPVYLIGGSDDRNYVTQNSIAENVHNSAIVQGNNATTLIVKNGGIEKRELNDNEVELLRILEILDVKGRTALMAYAFELEEKQKLRTEN